MSHVIEVTTQGQRHFKPEPHQAVFREFEMYTLGDNEEWFSQAILTLALRIKELNLQVQAKVDRSKNGANGYDFRNEVFEMFPSSSYECTCHVDEKLDAEFPIGRKCADDCLCVVYHKEKRRFDNAIRADYLEQQCTLQQEEQYCQQIRDLLKKYNLTSERQVECTCGFWAEHDRWIKDNPHTMQCDMKRPNFRCDDLIVRWYQRIGRGLSVNRLVTWVELEQIFARCHESLK